MRPKPNSSPAPLHQALQHLFCREDIGHSDLEFWLPDETFIPQGSEFILQRGKFSLLRIFIASYPSSSHRPSLSLTSFLRLLHLRQVSDILLTFPASLVLLSGTVFAQPEDSRRPWERFIEHLLWARNCRGCFPDDISQ